MRTETKTITRWANLLPNDGMALFLTRADADRYANTHRIACVELTGTYEHPVETVMVELTREDADNAARRLAGGADYVKRIAEACREALGADDER